ncbi:MAG: hypothetical protein IGS03_08640 [Candidatus Sericytochromatia bacterium]|nr:hypothetical protein [Candidatus Sericytochromatia bacterium]
MLVLEQGSDNYFLSLEKLNPEQRGALVEQLKSHLLATPDQAAPFALDDYLQVMQQDGQTQFQLGSEKNLTQTTPGQLHFDASLSDKQTIVNQANAQQAELAPLQGTAQEIQQQLLEMPVEEFSSRMWQFNNGQATADGHDPRFANGVQIQNGAPQLWISPKVTAPSASETNFATQFNALAPADRTRLYTQMLAYEFNIQQSLGNVSEVQFVEAMQRNQQAEGNPYAETQAFEQIAAGVYQMSQGELPASLLDENGGLDPQFVDKLQGMLNVLSPRVQSASDTNTKMQSHQAALSPEAYARLDPGEQQNYFQHGDLFIGRGDGTDGRATSMQRRFFGASLEVTPPSVSETHFSPVNLAVRSFDEMFRPGDRFTVDVSGSKASNANTVVEAQTGFNLERARNTFAESNTISVNNRKISDEDLLNTGSTFFGGPEALITAFGQNPADFQQYIQDGELIFDKVEGPNNSRQDIFAALGLEGRGETGVKAMLATLLFDRAFSTENMAGAYAENGLPPRLNAVVDEPEKSIQFLPVLQQVAEMKQAQLNSYIAENGLDLAPLTQPIELRVVALPTQTNLAALRAGTAFINLNHYQTDLSAASHAWIEGQFQVHEID